MMDSSIRNVLDSGNEVMKYDEHVKNLLSEKIILAWILKSVVKEVIHMSVSEIERCISDDIVISKVGVLPGLSNRKQYKVQSTKIIGESVESIIPGEGKRTFDLRFFFHLPRKKRKSIKLLLNVEAQKDFNKIYNFVTRGIFYCSRMISAQLETEFTKSEYQKIKKVYSIWICMESLNYIGNALTQYDIRKNDIVGTTPNKVADYDKMNVTLLYLNQKQDKKEKSIFHLLNTLLSAEKSVDEKMDVLRNEFQIDDSRQMKMEKELDEMCNLGEGLFEKGERRGERRGEKRGRKLGEEQLLMSLISKKIQKGKNISEIADALEMSEEDIKKVYYLVEKKLEKSA